MAENKSLFYNAKEVMEMLDLKKSKGYAYLDKAMATGKPFVVIRIDRISGKNVTSDFEEVY